MIGSVYYHFKRFGVSGVKAVIGYRVFGNRVTLSVNHPTLAHPVKIRIGTSDASVYDQVLVNTEYEFDISKDIKVIVDAGANIGLAAVLFASRFPEAHIYAIEPEKSNLFVLEENAKPYSNITVIPAALWDTVGEIELVDSGLGHWGFTARKSEAQITENPQFLSKVAAVTIDTLIADYKLSGIDILKIDIEGAEREVFRTADSWIEKVHSIIVELHDSMMPGCSESFERVASQFKNRWQRGENIYVSRSNTISPTESAS